jgi:hypothetical protein
MITLPGVSTYEPLNDLADVNQEPRCKQTGDGSGFAPEPDDSDCKSVLSPQSGGESDPYWIKAKQKVCEQQAD